MACSDVRHPALCPTPPAEPPEICFDLIRGPFRTDLLDVFGETTHDIGLKDAAANVRALLATVTSDTPALSSQFWLAFPPSATSRPVFSSPHSPDTCFAHGVLLSRFVTGGNVNVC